MFSISTFPNMNAISSGLSLSALIEVVFKLGLCSKIERIFSIFSFSTALHNAWKCISTDDSDAFILDSNVDPNKID